MIIIKKKSEDGKKNRNVIISDTTARKKKNPNVKTNWGIVDLGFANYNDKTNYATSASSGFTGSGVGKDQLELRNR